MLWWVAETTVVAGALACVAAMASRWGRLGPASRHALWALVVLKLLTPPLVQSPWAVGVPAALAALDAPTRAGAGPASRVEESPVVDPDPPEPVPAVADPGPRGVATVLNLLEKIGRSSADLAVRSPAVAQDGPAGRTEPPPGPAPALPEPWRPTRWLLGLWGGASVLLAAGQIGRLFRFAGRVRDGSEAPDWFLDEVAAMADRLGVTPPEVRVVDGLGVPLLWCLGRPKLLLPAHLVKTLGVENWRGVLAHELAHLRRGDPWFSRLALLAGWLWWWNPVYRLARRRLDAEAELACDAWVVWALPGQGDRLAYARTMIDICARLGGADVPAPPLAPALGSHGAGRLLERRIRMILNDSTSRRLSLPGLIAPALLAALALPSWTAARTDETPAGPGETGGPAVVVIETDARGTPRLLERVANPVRVEKRLVNGVSTVFVVAEDEDEDDDKPTTGAAKQKRVIVRRVNPAAGNDEAIQRARESLEKAARQYAAAASKAAKSTGDEAKAAADAARARLSEAKEALEKAVKAAAEGGKAEVKVEVLTEDVVGDDKDDDDRPQPKRPFQLRLRRRDQEAAEARAEARGKAAVKKAEKEDMEDDDDHDGDHEIDIDLDDLSEISKLFAPDSEAMKALESLGPVLSRAIRENFGEGTDFDAHMKELGAKIEAEVKEKLGPGSEFEKATKDLARALKDSLGPGSEFEKQLKGVIEQFEKRREGQADREFEVRVEVKKDEDAPKEKGPEAKADQKIKDLEQRIEELSKELERLRKAGKGD